MLRGQVSGYGVPEESPSATFSNEGGTGSHYDHNSVPKHAEAFVVAGVRVDASALEVKDLITASITSTTDADTVPLGGGSAEGSVAGVVGEVAAALKVTATKTPVWLVQPRPRRLPLRLPKAMRGLGVQPI